MNFPAQPYSESPLPPSSATISPSIPAPQPDSTLRRADQPRMRSSIACARCRRSKVKCVNEGVNTTCKACQNSGRECTYPMPAAAGGGVKRDAGSTIDPALQSERRPARPRKPLSATITGNGSHKDSPKAYVDALDPAVLTPQMWSDLFDIFQVHYSTDLPFLHPPTFKTSLRKSNVQSPSTANSDAKRSPMPPASPILLLSFLALTARFHPPLIALHSSPSKPQGALVAAEYYASAAKQQLSGAFGDELGKPDLDRTQALLMLGLHEWSMCRGAKAWILIGIAVRTAQILGLQFEQALDDQPLSSSSALKLEAKHMGIRNRNEGPLSRGDTFIEQEIRRRTFWSCFIMDRYLSSGKFRPQMLNVRELRIQLPSTDRSFLFGDKVTTSMLGEEEKDISSRVEVQESRKASFHLASLHDRPVETRTNDTGRLEVGDHEAILSRYIRLLDLHGRIIKWSCAGGRRQEEFPPWDPRCTFHELRRSLEHFKANLPRDLTFSETNTSAHISCGTSTPYTLMHALYALCSIILHREYVPFVPIRCSKPQGPLDPPLFPPEEYPPPPGFWEESGRQIFKSARDLIDLLRICQEWEVLVETPIIGFAAYTAAFCGVYAINFPWMDLDGHMCSKLPLVMHTKAQDNGGAAAGRKALEIVGRMRQRLRMADGWFKTIKRSHIYFMQIKKDFDRNTRNTGGATPDGSYRQLSLREGGSGGGLEEYKLIEKIMKDFGSLEDDNPDTMDIDSDGRNPLEDGSESGSGARSEMDAKEHALDMSRAGTDRWNAINSATTAPSRTNGQHPPFPMEPGHFTHGPGGVAIMSPTQPPYGAATSFERASYGNEPSQQHQHHREPLTRHHLDTPNAAQGQHGSWPDYRENWINNIDTRFGGDDVAAFIEGNTWEDFPNMGGWLGNVWNGAQTAGHI